MKFSIKDFFSKCDQIRYSAIHATEILKAFRSFAPGIYFGGLTPPPRSQAVRLATSLGSVAPSHQIMEKNQSSKR